MSRWIPLRNRMLDWTLDVTSDAVLNAQSPTSIPDAPAQCTDDMTQRVEDAMGNLRTLFVGADGMTVEYTALREHEVYRAYRTEVAGCLRHFDPLSLETIAQRTAFWINLYNLIIIDAVIALSIEERVTEGWLGILSFFRRAAYDVGGHRLSCDDIEQGILRANRGHPYLPGAQFTTTDPRAKLALAEIDPRIHCALNCAARACPPIRAYTAAHLEDQLERAARAFVAADVELDQAKGEVALSEIFKWYGQDFGGKRGLLDFLTRYWPQENEPDRMERAWLCRHSGREQGKDQITDATGITLHYRPHDWRLNTV